ncbi:hypothetical protein N7457_006583 [Penicillium paradoxum]|uniref:uncharacterized protein n=1 Tax=Penicillium paradoxum TaxID=176176 RepID=UPI0025469F7D|nr:uncharacterized protein N7457_006583 [Penicillium paradoxum]KAJ5778863.1 hypothetical protein N7457_006583 [Penicillium paradoxum]
MFAKLPSVAALVALSFTAQATQIFHNTGTTSGWDATNHEHNGKVQQVTNVVYQGSTALKMTQVYDPDYTGRYHSEVVKKDVYKRGDEGAYGFAFRLQQNWEFSPAQSYNIAQFIADFSDSECDGFMPSSMVFLEGDQLVSRVKQGTICKQKTVFFRNLATVTAGEWHLIQIEAKWESDETGYYKLWFDGELVLDKSNIKTTIEDDRAFQFRVGLYANGWYDDDGMQGTQGTRQIWYDEIAAGTTLADVDPDQW